MKKLFTIVLALLLSFSVVGCNKTPDDDNKNTGGGTTITLSSTTLSLPISGEQTIYATVKEGTVTWENSDASVVSTTPNSNSVKITALKAGTAEVTASIGDSEATCYVTVTNAKVELALTLGADAVEIRKGGSLFVPAKVTLDDKELEEATYTYQIADTSVATVTDGVVTGIKAGQTELSVVANYDGRKSNVITVPVIVKEGSVLLVSSSNVTLYDLKTDSEQFPIEKAITVKISDGTTASAIAYTANSSNEDVAVVENGIIKAKGVGQASISVACEQGGINYTATIFVTVKAAPMVVFKFPEDISLYTLEEGRPAPTYQLEADVFVDGKQIVPDAITYRLVEGSVVSVSESGLLTSLSTKTGSAKIEAKITFQGKEFVEIVDVATKMDTTLYYGNHIESGYAVPGMVARMTEGDTIMYYNVDFNNDKDTSLVRFQVIQDKANEGEAYEAPTGAKNIFITLQDAAKPSNYLTVLAAGLEVDDPYYSYGCRIAARVSSWVSYEVGSKDEVFYALKSGAKPMGIATAGWAGYNYGVNGYSFYNYWLNRLNNVNHNSTKLQDQMFSIGVQDKSVYFHINGTTVELLNMSDKVSGQAPWEGFTGDKLNVFVTTTGYSGSDQTHLVFDTLGGKPVTASMKFGFKVQKLGTSLVPNN